MNIPFNKPSIVGREIEYIKDAINLGKISGDGKYTKLCSERLTSLIKTKKNTYYNQRHSRIRNGGNPL